LQIYSEKELEICVIPNQYLFWCKILHYHDQKNFQWEGYKLFFTNKNQPKCNHSIYDYMRLDLWIFATTRPTFNYFDHFHNYDATIRNFILLVASILHLFSSINTLICPISDNSHQISYILKVFYNDIRVYFNVFTMYIYMHTYVYCSYNEAQN